MTFVYAVVIAIVVIVVIDVVLVDSGDGVVGGDGSDTGVGVELHCSCELLLFSCILELGLCLTRLTAPMPKQRRLSNNISTASTQERHSSNITTA